MKERETMLEAYLRRGFSRRDFLKGCVALTSLMGLSTDMVSKVAEAAQAKQLPVVIWLHGHECTGCDEAFIRSGAPLASDLVLNEIALEYDHLLSAAAGEPFEHHLEETMKKYHGEYILAVEGAVASLGGGYHCMSGGRPFIDLLRKAADGAKVVIAYGSCAAYGGIQAAKPNPTHSGGIGNYLGMKKVINVPGCPPIPEVMTGVIMHIALFGTLPAVDGEDRPKQFYGSRIHDTCYRRPFFDAGMFATSFDDTGAKAGWCLYKLGCRGPETYNSCGNLRWYQGLSYPIQSGAPCIGCSNAKFWDEGPFMDRLPSYGNFGNVNLDIDVLGTGMAVAATAGVALHGALSLVQKKKRQEADRREALALREEEENRRKRAEQEEEQ